MTGNEEEEETRKMPHRLRPRAQAPEPMVRRCFAVKEGLQPGGTAAFMTPRLYRRAVHDKSLKCSQGALQVIGLVQQAFTQNCFRIYLKGTHLSIVRQPFVEWRMDGCRTGKLPVEGACRLYLKDGGIAPRQKNGHTKQKPVCPPGQLLFSDQRKEEKALWRDF